MRTKVYSGVYKLTIGGVDYIGESKDINKRLIEHFECNDLPDSKLMQLHIEMGDWRDYKFETLEEDIDEKNLKELEDKYIAKYNTYYPSGFNIHTKEISSPYKEWVVFDTDYKVTYNYFPKSNNLFLENMLHFLENNDSQTKKRQFKAFEIILPKYLIDYVGRYNHLLNMRPIDYYFKYYTPKTIVELFKYEEIKDEIVKPQQIKVHRFFDYFEDINELSKTNLIKTLYGKHMSYDNRVFLNFDDGFKSFYKVTNKNINFKTYLNNIIKMIIETNDKKIKELYYEVKINNVLKPYKTIKDEENGIEGFIQPPKINIGYYKMDKFYLLFARYNDLPLFAKDILHEINKKHIFNKNEVYVIDQSTIVLKLRDKHFKDPLKEFTEILEKIIISANTTDFETKITEVKYSFR